MDPQEERNEALRTLDMDWARRVTPDGADDAALLAGLHKARHACPQIEMSLRVESANWLQSQGMSGMNGLPLDYFG